MYALERSELLGGARSLFGFLNTKRAGDLAPFPIPR